MDPLIHYITKGFDKKLAINRNYPHFVEYLHGNLHEQLDAFVTKKRIKKKNWLMSDIFQIQKF